MAWYVYMLLCGDGTLYTGMTDDVPRRLRAHRSGRGAKYTRGRGPLTLVYVQEQPSRSAALRREYQIKRLSRAQKDALRSGWAGEAAQCQTEKETAPKAICPKRCKGGTPVMSVEKVRAYFARFGMEDRVNELPQSSATVDLAAAALGVEPGRIAKTLSFLVGERPILIVAAGDTKIDNARYKARFGTKAKMLTPEQAVELVGHAVGGVCPFAVNDGVEVYLDRSLKRFETVFPACGSSNSEIELTIPELERCSNSLDWVDVCKDRQ